MKRGNIFWGIVLITLGLLFFLQKLGLPVDVFGMFWAIFLMLLGGWILMDRMKSDAQVDAVEEKFSIDLQGAAQVALDLDQGAGSVQVSGGAPAGVAVTGSKATGMEVKNRLVGDKLEVKIEAGPSFLPFLGPESGVWRYRLNQDVPLTIDVDAGASSLDFDLTDLKLVRMKIDMGATALKIKLPANAGASVLDIDAGAASLDLNVPQGVAARLRFEQGVSNVEVDQSRFPMAGSGLYQSADYDTATNKVDVTLDGGANTVKVW